jgi:peptide/nickel transport system substrate-binding protein
VSIAEYIYTSPMYDTLTELSVDGSSVLPGLATSWKFVNNGTAFQLTLRQGVTFHDGTPFDANAVKANLDRDMTVTGSTVAGSLKEISSVQVVSSNVVQLNVSSGGADLPSLFTSNVGEMVSPKALSGGADLAHNPGNAGTGPYVLSSFAPGDSATYDAAPSYWNSSVGPKVKHLKIEYVAQIPSRISGVQAGQINVAQISAVGIPSALTQIKAGTMKGYNLPVNDPYSLLLNTSKPPLNNLNVREAIAWAIDRNGISSSVFSGYCTADAQPYPKASPYYDASLDQLSGYDVAKAKQYLAASGLSNVSVTIDVAANSGEVPYAPVIQSDLQAVGITAKIETVSTPTTLFTGFGSGQLDTALTTLVPGADPSAFLTNDVLSGLSLARPGDPMTATITQLATEAKSGSTSDTVRANDYKTIISDMAQQVWYVEQCAPNNTWIYSNNVVGVEQTPGLWQGLPQFLGLGEKLP